MNKDIQIAKQTVQTQIQALKRLSASFNKSSPFTKAVNLISKIKGKCLVVGVGKSYIIGLKVASTLSIVIAQRLPRSICNNCKAEDTETSINKLNLIGITKKIKTFTGKGCSKCNQTGHKGRHGVYEILKITPAIQDSILKNKTSPEISIIAKKEGYKTIQEQGRELIEGDTD